MARSRCGRGARGRLRAAGVRHRGDPRPGTLPDDQVALGGELGVGVDGDAARHAELAREVARRGDQGAGVQRAVADRPAQAVLDLGAQCLRGVATDVEEQFNWSHILHRKWIWKLHQ